MAAATAHNVSINRSLSWTYYWSRSTSNWYESWFDSLLMRICIKASSQWRRNDQQRIVSKSRFMR